MNGAKLDQPLENIKKVDFWEAVLGTRNTGGRIYKLVIHYKNGAKQKLSGPKEVADVFNLSLRDVEYYDKFVRSMNKIGCDFDIISTEFDISEGGKMKLNEQSRPLYQIASDIKRDWKNVNYAAKPYLDAMFSLDQITDNYYADSGKSIVAYFLSNASSWRGPKAVEIKKELNSLLKEGKIRENVGRMKMKKSELKQLIREELDKNYDGLANVVSQIFDDEIYDDLHNLMGGPNKEVEKRLDIVIKEELTNLFEAGEGPGKYEMHATSLKDAIQYVKELGIYDDIPTFDQNFNLAKKFVGAFGKTQRKEMPVIDDSDVRRFQVRLKKGYVDINHPFSKTFNPKNPFPTGLHGFDAKDFLDRGLRDGEFGDDVISISIKQKTAGKLKPIQKQIYLDKSLGFIPKFGIEPTINFLTSKTFFITSEDDFIIDGHHRWLEAIVLNPKMKVNTLSIDLPINKLLPLATAYGDAIGNKRNM